MSSLKDRRFAGVIFDLDQTLIDSAPALVAAYTAWAIRYNLTEEDLQGFEGTPAKDIVKALIPGPSFDEALASVHELEETTMGGISALPGAARALAVLPKTRVAIATSGNHRVATRRIAAARLDRPGIFITFDDVDSGKPAPDPFLLAAQRLGVDPADCLVVEDAPAGLLGARRAGCATLAIATSLPASRLEADLVVDDLDDIDWIVESIGVGVIIKDWANSAPILRQDCTQSL